MRQQDALTVDRSDRRIGEQLYAGSPFEVGPVQKVAIAAHEVHGHAGIGEGPQLGADFRADRVWVVIADPSLEKIAEDVQRLRRPRPGAQKPDESLDRCRSARIEMQVGDEEVGHGCKS